MYVCMYVSVYVSLYLHLPFLLFLLLLILFISPSCFLILSFSLVQLYDEFISKFEAKLSPIPLAQIASVVGLSISNPTEGLLFFGRVLSSRAKLGVEASLCLDMDIVLVNLKAGEVSEAKVLLDEAQKVLCTISTSESFVFSKYFKSSCEYRKVN